MLADQSSILTAEIRKKIQEIVEQTSADTFHDVVDANHPLFVEELLPVYLLSCLCERIFYRPVHFSFLIFASLPCLLVLKMFPDLLSRKDAAGRLPLHHAAANGHRCSV